MAGMTERSTSMPTYPGQRHRKLQHPDVPATTSTSTGTGTGTGNHYHLFRNRLQDLQTMLDPPTHQQCNACLGDDIEPEHEKNYSFLIDKRTAVKHQVPKSLLELDDYNGEPMEIEGNYVCTDAFVDWWLREGPSPSVNGLQKIVRYFERNRNHLRRVMSASCLPTEEAASSTSPSQDAENEDNTEDEDDVEESVVTVHNSYSQA